MVLLGSRHSYIPFVIVSKIEHNAGLYQPTSKTTKPPQKKSEEARGGAKLSSPSLQAWRRNPPPFPPSPRCAPGETSTRPPLCACVPCRAKHDVSTAENKREGATRPSNGTAPERLDAFVFAPASPPERPATPAGAQGQGQDASGRCKSSTGAFFTSHNAPASLTKAYLVLSATEVERRPVDTRHHEMRYERMLYTVAYLPTSEHEALFCRDWLTAVRRAVAPPPRG